jgi:SAM-dependent methyltransferase
MFADGDEGRVPSGYRQFTGGALFKRAIVLPSVAENLGAFAVCGQPGLDVACGGGESTEPLEQAGARPVVGLDIAPAELPAYDAARPARFVAADDGRLPFRARTFQAVTSVFGWQNRGSKQAVLDIFREVGRVLRPGGVFLSLVSYWGTPDTDTWQYGVTAVTDRPSAAAPGTEPAEGAHRTVTVWNGREPVLRLDNWLWTEQTYREAVTAAGLVWLPPRFARPAPAAVTAEPAFWAPYLQRPQHIIIRAQAPQTTAAVPARSRGRARTVRARA